MENPRTGRTPARSARALTATSRASRIPSLAEGPAPGVRRTSHPERSNDVRLTVTAGEPPEHLFRRLLSAYLAGAGSFELVERPRLSGRTREVVREFCRRTRGPHLAAEGSQSLVLIQRESPGREPFDDQLLRLGEQVLAFHREVVEGWRGLPLTDDGAWARRDDEVDREAWYLERLIAVRPRAAAGETREATAAWTIARSLERIADHAVTLGEVGPRLADLDPASGTLRELLQYHGQAMEHLEEVLRSANGSTANDLLDVGEALLAGGRSLSERVLPAAGERAMAPGTAAAVARAFEAVGRTIAYSQDIAQAFFDRTLRLSVGPEGDRRPVAAAVPAG